jgi:uncharacterized protein with gpF-like domain
MARTSRESESLHLESLMPTQKEIAAFRRQTRERFRLARVVEREFALKLSGVGRNIGAIVKSFQVDGVIRDPTALRRSLLAYEEVLAPWAESIAARMQAQVSQRDISAWRKLSTEIGRALYREVTEAPTGLIQRDLMREQVVLIKSMPRVAADRVHELTMSALISGRRANEISYEIAQSGHVAIGRAKLIARTEVARTSSLLTQARAMHVGSDSYIWRTSRDSDVRPALSLSPREKAGFIGSHRALEGKVIRWSDPPVAGTRGERAHAGPIYNCRCWPEPIINDL